MNRLGDEEIDIFNFSFLDILSATIGALIFILLMIVISTTSLVERKIVDEVKRKNREVMAQLAKKNEMIAQMEQMNTNPSVLPRNDVANSITSGSGTVEAQKTDVKPNMERKVLTAAKGQIYLGNSRQPVSIKNTQAIEDALRQFLRYYDSNFEQLWWNIWEGGEETYKRANIVASSLKSVYSAGLRAAKEENLPDFSISREGRYGIDRNNDGSIDVLYVDNDEDGKWDMKYVNTDQDDFWEEVYIDYDFTEGKWRRKIVDTNFDRKYDLLLEDTIPHDKDWEIKLIEPNLKTNKPKEHYEDTNNDGLYDSKLVNTDFSDEDFEQSNTKYDHAFKRWKLSMIDTNGDGAPDVMWGDTDMNNVDWEEKYVDQDFDGVWDFRYRDLDPHDDDWEALYSKPIPNKDAWREVLVDTDEDGSWDKRMIDINGDGEYEKEIKLDSVARMN